MRLRLKLNLVNKSSRSMKNGTEQDSNLILNMAQVPIPPLAPNYVNQHDVWDQPWKYTGYKKYSWFLASDDHFMIFRRFGTLNARIILALQDELSVAEEKLKKLDEDYSSKSAPSCIMGLSAMRRMKSSSKNAENSSSNKGQDERVQ